MHEDTVSDPGLESVLQELGLTAEHLLDENESFIILQCRSDTDEKLVIKYIRGKTTVFG